MSMRGSFRAVFPRTGEAHSDESHFRGAAREVYSYLRLLAKHHGGFVFPTIQNISDHTKDYRHGQKPYSVRQCKRIIRMFQELGILGAYEGRVIRGHKYWGWQMADHDFWAEMVGGICDFRHWESAQEKQSRIMGNERSVLENADTDSLLAVTGEEFRGETSPETSPSTSPKTSPILVSTSQNTSPYCPTEVTLSSVN